MSLTISGLDKRLLKAISELGFTDLTEIQQKAIPVLLAGDRDFIGLAQTGTGKTAAFGLPIIQSIDTNNFDTQALILCPTRELCLQITKELKRYAAHMSAINVVAVYGGVAIGNQIRDLKRGAHIVVGTPGRLIDHIDRNTISLEHVMRLVLDEADQMFDMGFQEDIDTILASTPQEKHTWLFSATMQQRIEKIAHKYMNDPLHITVGHRNSGATNIEHQYCVVKKKDVYEVVRRLIDYYSDMFGIIFCATKREAQETAAQLAKDGYNADALHGDLSQTQRDSVMKKFRNRQLQILVATDVAARGIDVDDITHVIHCNIPDDIENYTHRSGRTARAGKCGKSIIVTSTSRKIPFIENHIGTTFTRVHVPTRDQICKKHIEKFANEFVQAPVQREIIGEYLDLVQTVWAPLSKEELVERIFSNHCSTILAYYRKAEDIVTDVAIESAQKSYKPTNSANRLSINIGKIDHMNSEKLIAFICKMASISRTAVSRVSMQNTRSFFTAQDSRIAQEIIRAVTNSSLKGRRIRVAPELG